MGRLRLCTYLWVQEVVVAVDDEVGLLHGVAGEEVGAHALLRSEPLQVVKVVHTGRQRDLAEKEVNTTIISLGPKKFGRLSSL